MISKNIKKSSQFLIIAPEYMKVKESRQTNIHKSGLASPKFLPPHKIQIKHKSKAIDSIAKQSQKLLEKVRSLSPRSKEGANSQSQINPRNRIHKSKSKKEASFQRWKSELFRSFDGREYMKSSHRKASYRPQDSSRKTNKHKESITMQIAPSDYQMLVDRTQTLLKAYQDKVKEVKEINRNLILQNCHLKGKLAKYEKS